MTDREAIFRPGPGRRWSIVHIDPEFVDMRTDSDCLRACLATITGRPWDEAPDNVGNWRRKAVDFLTSHPRSEWVVGIGESPRGCKGGHAIVCTPDGQMVHDPHPSRDGVVAMWELWDEHGAVAVDQIDLAHRATSERAIPEPTEGQNRG